MLAGSAVSVQLMELSHWSYEELTRVEQIAYPTFSLRDIQSGLVRSLVVSMCALGLNYRNRMITVTRAVECNRTDSLTEDKIEKKVAERSWKRDSR